MNPTHSFPPTKEKRVSPKGLPSPPRIHTTERRQQRRVQTIGFFVFFVCGQGTRKPRLSKEGCEILTSFRKTRLLSFPEYIDTVSPDKDRYFFTVFLSPLNDPGGSTERGKRNNVCKNIDLTFFGARIRRV